MEKKIYEIPVGTIESLAKIVAENHLEEISIHDGEQTITIKGSKPCPPPQGPGPGPGPRPPRGDGKNGPPGPPKGGPCGGKPPAPPEGQPPYPGAPKEDVPPAPAADETPAPAVDVAKGEKVIKAPIVGTFYAAPSPDQAPFVKVGDTVKKGDVVCIIESMKLMNEVNSDVDGVVREIVVKSGDAVEYDQPLIILS